jgi:hypothetical protein
MLCNEAPYWNTYWTTAQASGGGKSHQLDLLLNVTPQQQYYLSAGANPASIGGYVILSPGGAGTTLARR